MKSRKKAKAHAKHRSASVTKRPMQEFSKTPTKPDTSPRIETSSRGAQEGGGPLNQEGEGNRQNDEIAELEEIKPDLEEK